MADPKLFLLMDEVCKDLSRANEFCDLVYETYGDEERGGPYEPISQVQEYWRDKDITNENEYQLYMLCRTGMFIPEVSPRL